MNKTSSDWIYRLYMSSAASGYCKKTLQLMSKFGIKLRKEALHYNFLVANLRSLRGNRSSHRRCSVRNGILRKLAKFTGKHLCKSLFFNKVSGLRPLTLLKRRLWHKCFPMNFAKFLRTPIFKNTSERVLLNKLITIKHLTRTEN